MMLQVYTVLIVDDDCLVRETLQSIINWEAHGLAIVDTAIDGIDAMEKLNHYRPHILILDMSMPQADGIEVIRHIKSCNYNTRILALSCYDDFTYVKEALRLGASDYILKHLLKPEVLIEALDCIKNDMQQSLYDSKRSTQIRVLANEGKPLLKNKLLQKILTGDDYAGSKERDFKRYCKKLPLNNLGLIYYRVINYNEAMSELQPGGEEILTLALTNIIKEEVGKVALNEVVDMGTGGCVIIIHLGMKSRATNKLTLESVINKVNIQLETFLNIRGRAVTSMQSVSLKGLNKLYTELLHKFNHFFYEPEDTPILFSNFYPFFGTYCCELHNKQIEHYKNKIKLMDFQGLQEDILKELEKYRDLKVYPEELLRHYRYMIRVLEDHIYDALHLKMETLLEQSVDSKGQIQELTHINALEETIRNLISDAKRIMDNVQIEDVMNEYIREAIKYIQAHYMEDINLGEVASRIHVTRTYLSHLFNQETGTKFIDYVREVRIKKACYYLTSTNKSIKDIAVEVGIPNRKYFSKTFKAVMGISPQEYKRANI